MSTLALVTWALLAGAPDAGPGLADACSAALGRGVARVEKAPSAKRASRALRLLGSACPDVLGPLSRTALQASDQPNKQRAGVLLAGVEKVGPCQSGSATASAGPLWEACPAAPLELAEGLVKDLDSGTYLFAVAVARKLDGAGAFGPAAERVLSILLLASAH